MPTIWPACMTWKGLIYTLIYKSPTLSVLVTQQETPKDHRSQPEM